MSLISKYFWVLTCLFIVASCSASYTTAESDAELATGVTSLASSSYNPDEDTEMTATGNLSGTTIAIPAGAFGDEALTLSVFEGESIVEVSSDLGLSNDVSSAGPAVVIEASQIKNASTPFSITLPLSSSSLWLNASCFHSVVYQNLREGKANETTIGVMPKSALEIGTDSIKVQASYLGVYQPICSPVEIVERVEVQSAKPIVKVANTSVNPFIGSWIMDNCELYEENGPHTGDGSSETYNAEKEPEYELSRLIITDTEFAFSSKTSNNEDCSKPFVSFIMKGTFSINSEKNSSGAHDLDITPNMIYYTPLSEDVVTCWNEIKFCDYDEWAVGKSTQSLVECRDKDMDSACGNDDSSTSSSTTDGPSDQGPHTQGEDEGDDEGVQIGETWYTMIRTYNNNVNKMQIADSENSESESESHENEFDGSSPAKRQYYFRDDDISERIKR